VSEIVECFARICRDRPDRPLIFLPARGRTISAAAIQEQHQDLRRRIQRGHLASGELVISGTGNRVDLIPLLLACRSLGLALMAADPGTTPFDLVQLGARFGAAALIVAAESTNHRGDGLDILSCEAERTTYPQAAMLKLTSGSTGLPKAIVTTDAQLVADGRQIAASMGIGPADTQLAAIPLSHSYGLGVLVMPLLLQGTPLVLRESFVPQQLAADAQEFDVRRFPGVPFMFEYLVDHPATTAWPATLGRLVSAGAPLSSAAIRAFHRRYGVKIHAFYGTTETGGITYDDSDDPGDAETVGRPLEGVTLDLRPEEDAPGGRVHVRSGAVATGYAGPDRGDFIDEGFLTGDYGAIDAKGRLTLLGRASMFINVAGRKVQPSEVEAVLREMPQVGDVRVLGGKDQRRGEHVVACIVPRLESEPLTAAAVRRFCAARLAPHKVPREVVFVAAIPLTARGKTDREALAASIRLQQKPEW
jgi:acyl-CoA synthetase (AMP-forming)/AMP-acid ligase II